MPPPPFKIPASLLLRGATLGLCFFVWCAGLAAQDKSALPTAATSAAVTITLPVSGELTRSYSAGLVSVRVVSQPYFSAVAAGAPALEIGPASLTFMRDKQGGALLLLGDTPLTLPVSIPLGDDGRSKQPLDFTLSYDQSNSTANLMLTGKPYTVPATGSVGPVGLVLAAGDEQAWKLDTFEVTAKAAGTVGAESTSDAGVDSTQLVPRTANPAVLAADRAKDFEDSQTLLKAGDLAGAEKALLKSNRWPADTVGWRLESAGRLVQLALFQRQQFDHRGAIALGQRALAILREVDKVAPKEGVRDRSQAHEMAAYIADEILRDPAMARADYEQALKINGSSSRARAGVQRLDAAQAKAARLGANAK